MRHSPHPHTRHNHHLSLEIVRGVLFTSTARAHDQIQQWVQNIGCFWAMTTFPARFSAIILPPSDHKCSHYHVRVLVALINKTRKGVPDAPPKPLHRMRLVMKIAALRRPSKCWTSGRSYIPETQDPTKIDTRHEERQQQSMQLI